jgi:hypothetical protein
VRGGGGGVGSFTTPNHTSDGGERREAAVSQSQNLHSPCGSQRDVLARCRSKSECACAFHEQIKISHARC